jgi:hypothetical protein
MQLWLGLRNDDTEFGAINLKPLLKISMKFARKKVYSPNEVLTEEEIAAIHLYTQDGPVYRVLNARLRTADQERLEPYFPLMKLLLTGLYNLPVAVMQTVYRGVRADLSTQYPVGKEVVWWPFSSATTTVDVLNNPTFLGPTGERTIFAISVQVGYDIHGYSALGMEHEVLLPPRSSFKVKGLLVLGDGAHMVQLEQQPYEALSSIGTILPAPSSVPILLSRPPGHPNVGPQKRVMLMHRVPPRSSFPASSLQFPPSPDEHESRESFHLTNIDALLAAVIRSPFVERVHRDLYDALNRIVGIKDKHDRGVALAQSVASLVTVMRRHLSDEGVQNVTCCAIVRLACPDIQEAIGQALLANEITCLTAAMRAHPRSVFLQSVGCNALTLFASNNKTLVEEAGGIECTIAAMRAHPGNADVQHNGCGVIVNLSDNLAYKVTFVKSGGIECIVAAMRAHPGHAGVQHHGCWALGKLSSADSVPMASHEVNPALVPCVDAKQFPTCVYTLRVSSLNAKASIELAAAIISAGGIECIVAAMRAFPSNFDVQFLGCGAFKSITMSVGNLRAVAQAGGIECIVAAIRNHPDHADLFYFGCRVLSLYAELCLQDSHCGNPDWITIITSSMRMHVHSSNFDVQLQGCMALTNIAACKEMQEAFHDSDAVESILGAMRAHLHNPGNSEWNFTLQRVGCIALLNLGIRGVNKSSVAQAGGIDCIFAAMRTYPSKADVQTFACAALAYISWDLLPGHVAVARGAGIKLIISAMRAHASDAGVQREGCSALAAMASQDSESKVAIAKAGGIE